MNSKVRRRGFATITSIALLTVAALAVWLGSEAGHHPAEANHGVTMGIDTDTSGSTALALGTIQPCRVISSGQIIDIDIYVTALDNLAAWGAYVKYDTSKIIVTAPGNNDQNNNSRFLLQQAQPSPPGNSLFNTSETLPDNANPGTYFVGAYDGVVIPGFEDPDPINHTHKDGVLVRLQIQGKPGIGGFSLLQIQPFTAPGAGLVGPFMTDAAGALVADANEDGFVDTVNNAGIVVGSGSCSDTDADGIPDASDNCPTVPNTNQLNYDGDLLGDACDTDDDNDGLLDVNEPAGCSLDGDCDNDLISDGNLDPDSFGPIVAGPDNCVTAGNPSQTNTDNPQDALGDSCDPDDDHDGICDTGGPLLNGTPGTPAGGCAVGSNPSGADNCRTVVNANQLNTDSGFGDILGNACDTEDDGDGFLDTTELHIGTDPLDPCGNPSPGSTQIYSQAWPADLRMDGTVLPTANKDNLPDLQSFITPFRRVNTSPGDEPAFNIRWDLVPGPGVFGKHINLADLQLLITVTPLMFNNQKAFNYTTPCTP